MKSAAKIYGKVANKISSPRELEADLCWMRRAACNLYKSRGTAKTRTSISALAYNRKLWTLFMSAVTSNDNPLPTDLRQNVANLGLFVCKQTMAILADPKPQNLGSLISINRELAAGLLGRA